MINIYKRSRIFFKNFNNPDRGDVLSFVPSQGLGVLGNTLWSPYLVANSNCSCVMTFIYLIYGPDVSEAHVN